MKRKRTSRDDDDNDPSVGCSKLKINRPATTVYSRRGQMSAKGGGIRVGSPRSPTPMDPHLFLQTVDHRFRDDRDRFHEFRQILCDYKFQKIDGGVVAAKIEPLFVGHPDLILGFNTFLPPEHQIKVVETNPSPSLSKQDVVEPARRRSKDDDKPHGKFLVNQDDYKDYKPARKEFLQFKEDEDGIRLKEECEKQHQPGEVKKATDFMNKVKSRFQGDSHVYIGFLELLDVYQQESKSITEVYQEVAILFRGHRDLLDEFKEFLPDPSAPTLQLMPGKGVDFAASQDMDMDVSPVEAIDFMHKVKARFKSDCNMYRAFLEIMSVYQEENKSATEVYQEVLVLFDDHQDLLDGFTIFLPDSCDVRHDLPASSTPLLPQEDDRSAAPTSVLIHGAEKDRNHDWEGERERSDKIAVPNKGPSFHKEKCVSKPLSEFDYNPSYQKNNQLSSASEMSELEFQVLNDIWVCVPYGNGIPRSEGSLKKNRHEESLFRYEDERFELDMLIESVKSTANHAEKLLDKIEEKCNLNYPIRIEDHFTVLNLKCIERIYGDGGPVMLNKLREDTTLTLHILLKRLKQKQEEWSKSRSDFDKVWAEIHAKSRDKSLEQSS